jgi:hypothetical protein
MDGMLSMGRKKTFGMGAIAIIVVAAPGVAYWAMRHDPQSRPHPTSVANSPSAPVHTPSVPESSPAIGEGNPGAGSLPPASPPPQVSTPRNASSNPATPAPPSQASLPAAPSAAMASAMPSEDKMSDANRRQIQEALHRLGYYDGPIDGIFGPATRGGHPSFPGQHRRERDRSSDGSGGESIGEPILTVRAS